MCSSVLISCMVTSKNKIQAAVDGAQTVVALQLQSADKYMWVAEF